MTSSSNYRPGYEVAAERILEYIAERALPPGTRLPTEVELSVELGVSRSVTREALKLLSALGRVRVRRGAGIFVASEPAQLAGTDPFRLFLPADLGQVDSFFEFRLMVERETATLAAMRATPSQVREIAGAAERGLTAAHADDFVAFRGADDDFHHAVAAATHNPMLLATLDTAARLKREVLTLGLHGEASGALLPAAEGHQQIATAIAVGEPLAAAAAMEAHVNTSLDQFREHIRTRVAEALEDER